MVTNFIVIFTVSFLDTMIKIAFLCLLTFSLFMISLQQEEEENVEDEPNCKRYREIVSFRSNSSVMTM